MINLDAIRLASKNWDQAKPFPHCIVDSFFKEDIAKQLENEFPDYMSNIWHEYKNAIEIKKLCNNWNIFPKLTYQVFTYLNSKKFVNVLSGVLFDGIPIYSDAGLHGGGWHIHKRGGMLNTHLDYSIHPKLGLQRKLNIIIYLNSKWKGEWGGHLGLWGNDSAESPGDLVKKIEPTFNRAVIFDTTHNSWHGLPDPLTCPENEYRKSLAVYYLTEPLENVSERGKALFAPTDSQKDDKDVLELIKKRSDVNTAADVYIK